MADALESGIGNAKFGMKMKGVAGLLEGKWEQHGRSIR